jgi:putative endonuclease
MEYWVYILQSEKDGKYYIGMTSNPENRLTFHNMGLQRSTRHRIPFKMIYKEKQPDKTTAIKREQQIKRYKGGAAFKKLLREV